MPLVKSQRLNVPLNGKTGFTRLTSATTGIFFTNQAPDTLVTQNRILENGSGVALGDVDGDGLCDIYLCRLDGPNALYRNLGRWKFEDITEAAGVACAGQFSTGAVFADIDGDGDLDLLVNSLGGGTRCFRNDGKGHFTEDLNSGLLRKFGSMSMALADIDGDGDLDLYVANYRTTTIRDNPPEDFQIANVKGNIVATPAERFEVLRKPNGEPVVFEKGEADILYLNDGHGHFTPASWTDGRFLDEQGKPLASPPRHWGLTAAFHDINGDGAPDLYVCNDFIDSPDDIWINDGRGHFRRIAPLAIRNTSLSSMAIDFADINRDGFVDFIVVDMLSRDHRLRQTQRANVDLASTSVRIGEINNRQQNPRNTLFLNRGDGTFAEIAQLGGVQASEWSWSAIFLDVDLDGFEDLLVTNGNGHDIQDADTAMKALAMTRGIPPKDQPKTLLMYPRLPTANLAFRNRGDLTFEEIGAAWGFNAIGISHGMALADLDNDGDLDVVVNNFNGAVGIYRNESIAPRLAIRLRGETPNTKGIGARIKISGGPVEQTQEIICGGRYLSSDDPMRVFATGTPTNRMTIEVRWRSGKQSLVSDARANFLYEIEEPKAAKGDEVARGALEGSPANRGRSDRASSVSNQSVASSISNSTNQSRVRGFSPSASRSDGPYFRDVSELIHHTHFETGFDDFARQPLLPHRFSQLGPGVAWFDLNQDGWDDLIIGAGRGGEVVVFQNEMGRGFKRLPNGKIFAPAAGDQTTIVGWNPRPGAAALLLGVSNYEGAGTSLPSVIGYEIKSGRLEESQALTGQTASVGPMALADIDGDGDLDLFVGGRLNPGRWPEPATSRLYRNFRGELCLDLEASRAFVNVGLVSGAVFSDLDGDGQPDLVLACDCGPVRVFRNANGKFSDVTKELGLDSFLGRWNGVATGDFDGDGRLDIVASNWGRNTKYQSSLNHPLQIYYGDFNKNGTIGVVETYFEPTMNKRVPWRGFVGLSRAIPSIQERIPSFQAFASSSVEKILGDAFAAAHQLTVNTLDSMIFLNRSGRFEAKPLPVEAQFAPAFGVSVGDFDGDGKEDIFLSQNFFAVHSETSRYDAGRGLWLRGDGQGGFTAVSGQESGILVYGDQRGAALADYDSDGRVDLVVTQNGAATKLYHNERAKPGLRIELHGPPGNLATIGAVVRLVFNEKLGPAREITAGSGYWSQNSATLVMGSIEPPTGVWVRWPGGRVTTTSLPRNTRKVRISDSGKIEATN